MKKIKDLARVASKNGLKICILPAVTKNDICHIEVSRNGVIESNIHPSTQQYAITHLSLYL